MSSKNTTIHDVARYAGVSSMTVSRVINNAANVREKTRLKVQESIEALNYHPNLSARALSSSKSFRIAILYENPSESYLSTLLVGALEEATRTGHQLCVHKFLHTANSTKLFDELSALSALYEGIIVPPPISDLDIIRDFIAEKNYPALLLSSKHVNGRSSKVYINDFEAAQNITRHLIEMGHSKIGIIKGNPNQHSSSERFNGFLAALKSNEIDLKSDWIETGDYTGESGARSARKLLQLSDRPTAIFASNDDMAVGTLATASEMKLSVPTDLSVVGFDDSPIATQVFPKLTTIQQPVSQMAAHGVNELVKLIAATKSKVLISPSQMTVPFKLIKRDSVSPPT